MILPQPDQLLAFAHAHVMIVVAFVAVLVAIAANELHGRLSAGPRLGAPDAVRLLNDRNALVIDIRSAADFKKSHLLRAINVPAAKLKENTGQFGKDKERPIIVYCNMGATSLEAAKTLRALGHKEVYPLRGGINGWQNSNLPVTAK